jgi:hypothetical protein
MMESKLSTISANHRYWHKLVEALRTKDLDTLRGFLDPETAANKFCQGFFRIENGVVYYKDAPLANCLSKRIVDMMDDGFDIQPMVRFVNNLMQNPSNRAIEETYKFLEVCALPLTEDGCFVAYKRIRGDWKDVYSGTIDNSIGSRPSMPRQYVDDTCNRTCSHGLHVCSINYLAHYSGERLVAVKVNPRDVVSIPVDYENSKMRVCEYEVLQELDMATIAAFDATLSSVWKDTQPDDDESDEEYNSHYAEDEDEDDGHND